ncbi:MAG: M20/M25/M40 family metallo-hydrolase [Armatimonadetes bacterium]|nr:M20/M25/M40 family metallo-hydrolase [Armatimonadota bacterium]
MLSILVAAVNILTVLDKIDPERLQATVEKLASFHTRNTFSPTLNDAADWLAGEYRKIPGVQVELMTYTPPKGRRIPEEKEVVQVVATLTGEDDRALIVGGHIDSLNLQGGIDGRAPGANDDASGTALALEVARAMAGRKWKHTLKFVGWTGEEQGLHGSRAMAKKARAEGWKIDAVLSNDTVGSSSNRNGQKDDKRVRVFSEASDSHRSRELARFIAWLVREDKFGVKLVFRKDRFGRGGDHSPFNDEGFSAVRFVEVHEEYTRQHTEDDLPEHMDFSFLANVAGVNLRVLSALANAGAPPSDVEIDRRQGHDTTIKWVAVLGTEYMVYWRETTSPTWQSSRKVGAVSQTTIEKVNKDDHVFAVGAVGGIPVEAK